MLESMVLVSGLISFYSYFKTVITFELKKTHLFSQLYRCVFVNRKELFYVELCK